MVARLAAGDATVNELAAPCDLTLPGISKHLMVLERCGLISRSFTTSLDRLGAYLIALARSAPSPGEPVNPEGQLSQ